MMCLLRCAGAPDGESGQALALPRGDWGPVSPATGRRISRARARPACPSTSPIISAPWSSSPQFPAQGVDPGQRGGGRLGKPSAGPALRRNPSLATSPSHTQHNGPWPAQTQDGGRSPVCSWKPASVYDHLTTAATRVDPAEAVVAATLRARTRSRWNEGRRTRPLRQPVARHGGTEPSAPESETRRHVAGRVEEGRRTLFRVEGVAVRRTTSAAACVP
jgi:hypothetical protein